MLDFLSIHWDVFVILSFIFIIIDALIGTNNSFHYPTDAEALEILRLGYDPLNKRSPSHIFAKLSIISCILFIIGVATTVLKTS